MILKEWVVEPVGIERLTLFAQYAGGLENGQKNFGRLRRKDWLCGANGALLWVPAPLGRGETYRAKRAFLNPAAERRLAGSRWWRRVLP